MAKDWYLPNKSQVFNGGHEKEEFQDYAQSGFNETLSESFLGEPVTLYSNGLDESTAVKLKCVVQNNTSNSQNLTRIRQILAPIGTLKLGMYVLHHGDIFMVISHPSNDMIYEKCTMEKCDYDLKWKNRTGNIISRWAVVDDNISSASGVSINKHLVLGSARMGITLPKDQETIDIRRGKRFIIDDYDAAYYRKTAQVFKVTKVSFLQINDKDGLFYYSLDEDSFSSVRDSIENMVADYDTYWK